MIGSRTFVGGASDGANDSSPVCRLPISSFEKALRIRSECAGDGAVGKRARAGDSPEGVLPCLGGSVCRVNLVTNVSRRAINGEIFHLAADEAIEILSGHVVRFSNSRIPGLDEQILDVLD